MMCVVCVCSYFMLKDKLAYCLSIQIPFTYQYYVLLTILTGASWGYRGSIPSDPALCGSRPLVTPY